MNGASSKTIDPEKLARLESLLDRQDILDCVTRVSRAIDRFDRDLFLSGYHPDAVIDAGEFVGDPAKVYEAGAALHEHGQSSTLHHLTNHTCEIDGDVAHTETYWQYTGRNRDGTNWAAGGRYVDRLERRTGEWRIAFRCTLLEWSGTIPPRRFPCSKMCRTLMSMASPRAVRRIPPIDAPSSTGGSCVFPKIRVRSVCRGAERASTTTTWRQQCQS